MKPTQGFRRIMLGLARSPAARCGSGVPWYDGCVLRRQQFSAATNRISQEFTVVSLPGKYAL